MPPQASSRSARAAAPTGRPGGRSGAGERERLLRILTAVVEHAGYDLEDVTVTAAGRRNLVRVVVDRDGGIDLDAVAEVSRVVSDALDSNGDAFAGPYVLEVTSPGVDRPLTEPRHWRRAIGRLVTVPVGEATASGRIRHVDDAGVTLQTDAGERQFAWADLGKGRVQVEFHQEAAGEGE